MSRSEQAELPAMPAMDEVGAAAIEFLTCRDRQADAKEATEQAAERCASAMLAANRAEIRIGERIVKLKYIEAQATVSAGKAKCGTVPARGGRDAE
jgi:hypothetical protein